MPPRKTVPPSHVVSQSRKLREQARKDLQRSFLLIQTIQGQTPLKSSQLCRQSNELVRRSRNLREQLRRIKDAA